jgi:imidazolonepropionase
MSDTLGQGLGRDVLVLNIGELATPLGAAARSGSAMRDIRRVPDAAIAVRDGRIEYAGPRSDLRAEIAEGLDSFDARGAAAVPGFVDSHSHFVFSGYRSDEFLARARGESYMEIHRRGGGILRTVEATRAAGFEELVAAAEKRAWAMIQQGVTATESKSGYGLDLDTELRQLEVSAALADRVPLDVVPTYLGLHAVPPEFEGNASRYVDFVINEVLLGIASQDKARFCDAFCEPGVFGLEDCRRYFEAAKKAGLGLRIHADEIERSGGAALAAELGMASADHLLAATAEDFAAMAASSVIATCLPLTSFCLGKKHANGRAMIDAGCALALGSDLNPGSACSGSIPLMIALAVLQMGLSVEETLTAITLNGAASLGLASEQGSLEAGKKADIVLLDAPSLDFLPYRSGANIVSAVFKDGELVYRA